MKLADTPEARIALEKAEAEMRQAAEEARAMETDEKMRLLWNTARDIYSDLEDHRVPE